MNFEIYRTKTNKIYIALVLYIIKVTYFCSQFNLKMISYNCKSNFQKYKNIIMSISDNFQMEYKICL